MGGVSKTIQRGISETGKILSGKGKLQDFGEIVTGNSLGGDSKPYDPAANPYLLDPSDQGSGNQSILDLANQQSTDTQAFNTSDQASRATARQNLAEALTKQAQTSFQQSLPETEETLNAQHLLNGSGLGQEIARQQGNIAANIANQVGAQGATDINRASDIGFQGLQGKQAQQAAALSRSFSLQDFIRQARVAKDIGATTAPVMPSGKSTGVSGGLAGAGTGAAIGTGITPGYGTALGALLGGAAGYAGGSLR